MKKITKPHNIKVYRNINDTIKKNIAFALPEEKINNIAVTTNATTKTAIG